MVAWEIYALVSARMILSDTEPATAIPSARGAPEPPAVNEPINPPWVANTSSASAITVARSINAWVSAVISFALNDPAMPTDVPEPLLDWIATAPASEPI